MAAKDHKKSALTVNPGINQPPDISEQGAELIRTRRKKSLTEDDYIRGILAGDTMILSRAITLVESHRSDHRLMARKIVEKCLPHSGKSIRIGITGVPGVGKSTFVESMGLYLARMDKKVAVLAIDPSSEKSGGSILGDKTRMEELSSHPKAYIRPSPSSGTLGGVARKTRETILLCEAAGYETIFIETVGVGQSETVVHSMVDFFLLLMLAGAGDELQGIKRGIMEMADLITINKADGTNVAKAQSARVQYQNAVQLFPLPESGWKPRVLTCSAIHFTGVPEIWEALEDYRQFTGSNGYFEARRKKQSLHWMYETIHERLREDFYQNGQVKAALKSIEQAVLNSEISSVAAAEVLLKLNQSEHRNP